MSLVPANATAAANHTIKFLSTSVGRDRLNRFIQYLANFLAWYLANGKGENDLVSRLAKLSLAVGQTRKLMRVGRQLEFVMTIAKSKGIKDDLLRYVAILKNLSLFGWLSHDMFQWAHSVGIVKLSNIKQITERGMKCWLTALCVSFIGGLYRLQINSIRLTQEHKAEKMGKEGGEKNVKLLQSERNRILLALLQDGLDMLLPGSALQYTTLNRGVVSAAGITTSLIGGYLQWVSI
ncbi:peroxisomal biogenesis factor 11 [Polychytrium aggregatum]|uniref:peroxisomal biogenesis factor 11 n=1 Tax=Polychytrium aggregatum TaxID=110093 RepID=UPI0022FEFDF7|nr:peroxisomal biogenesis factor 11 [Polychytrium aggregatum]KAI9207561.1 peroxisomal biogenesis factor 11 [Polychytrium aggregatum]